MTSTTITLRISCQNSLLLKVFSTDSDLYWRSEFSNHKKITFKMITYFEIFRVIGNWLKVLKLSIHKMSLCCPINLIHFILKSKISIHLYFLSSNNTSRAIRIRWRRRIFIIRFRIRTLSFLFRFRYFFFLFVLLLLLNSSLSK